MEEGERCEVWSVDRELREEEFLWGGERKSWLRRGKKRGGEEMKWWNGWGCFRCDQRLQVMREVGKREARTVRAR